MKHNYTAIYNNVRIRPLAEEDIEKLREWRNDSSQTKFLRNIGHITSEMQLKWYKEYLEDESQMIYAIDEISELNRMVGSLAVYDIDHQKSTAEIGKIQIGDSKAHGRGIGRISLVMAMKLAINKMNISKIIGEVSPYNVQAYANDMKIGFRVVGEHYTDTGIFEYEIELEEDDLKKANDYYDEIIMAEE